MRSIPLPLGTGNDVVSRGVPQGLPTHPSPCLGSPHSSTFHTQNPVSLADAESTSMETSMIDIFKEFRRQNQGVKSPGSGHQSDVSSGFRFTTRPSQDPHQLPRAPRSSQSCLVTTMTDSPVGTVSLQCNALRTPIDSWYHIIAISPSDLYDLVAFRLYHWVVSQSCRLHD